MVAKKKVAKKTISKKVKLKSWKYPAFKVQQKPNAPTFAILAAPIGEIRQWAKPDVLSSKNTGAQRELKDAKVMAIKKFLVSDPANVIPTALIIAFGKGEATLIAEGDRSSLEILPGKKGAVVDGQHRMVGIDQFNSKTIVPVVVLVNCNAVEQAFQFLIVNNKATRVTAKHYKALIAKMADTNLEKRLKSAKIAFDAVGIGDIDLVNTDSESPFYNNIDWQTTPAPRRIVQATAIEQSLNYLEGQKIAELEDRDVRRVFFLTIWSTIKEEWPDLWKKNSRLISKVGIVALTRLIVDFIVNWADNPESEIDLASLEDVRVQTQLIIKRLDQRFWTAPWAETAQGGFDTNQGRDRVVEALKTLYRNGAKKITWHSGIEIIQGYDN